MQLGFLIDHRRCIGCHACTVACKSENDVPVGSFRTWVKYTEVGKFPEVRRHFAVLRCNHCSNAPCVTICPVNALGKRDDGIVDLDRDACIGCRACMQACPYDAIYLNEDSGAAEKCHFCAHRVEQGLEPACVVVCPEQAIVHGDLHEPTSRIAEMAREHTTEVRRPEQGTGPNVHYLGHESVTLAPGAAERPPTYIWSDRPPHKDEDWPSELPLTPDARTVLDAGHPVHWGGGVATYLLTKGLAAGAAMLAPFVGAFGLEGFSARYLPELAGLVFTLVTCLLLIEDLARPKLFLRLLTRPNWNSWLVKGGIVLGIFAALEGAILALTWLGSDGIAAMLRWPAAVAGLAVAGYTAFLFGQCEGRDLWQSKLLLPHLLVQAALLGSALYLLDAPESGMLRAVFLLSAAVHALLAILEWKGGHATTNARQAAAFLPVVRFPKPGGALHAFREGLWIGVLLAGILVALGAPPIFSFLAASFGLLLYEWAYVRAAQLPPLS